MQKYSFLFKIHQLPWRKSDFGILLLPFRKKKSQKTPRRSLVKVMRRIFLSFLLTFALVILTRSQATLVYKNLNCLEINLSNQTLESVEKFLLEENTDRIWFNNQEYCIWANNRIGQKYSGHVRIFHLNRLLAWYGSETVPPTDTASNECWAKPNQISCSRLTQTSLHTSSHVLMFSCLNKNLFLFLSEDFWRHQHFF